MSDTVVDETGLPGESGAEMPTPVVSYFTAQEREIILSWLGPLPEEIPKDPSNAYEDDPRAVELGLELFFDPGYSADGKISCATCHEPGIGFSDARGNVSEGVTLMTRASMGLFNGAYGAAAEGDTNWQLWDGRTDSQWAQALVPPEGGAAMGSTRSKVALFLYDNYREQYEEIFGPMPEFRDADDEPWIPEELKPGVEGWDELEEDAKLAVNEVFANFGKALAAYERLLVSRNSRFDRYWEALAAGEPDSDILSEEEKLGLRVFIGRGRCLGCHSGPNFTDGQFHNIAVPQLGPNTPETDQGRAGGIARVMGDEFNCAGPWSDHPDKAQCGVMSLTGERAEVGAFKTPSLRSVSLTAPYMHTGNFATLDEVIRHYDMGGGTSGTFQGRRDELMRPLSLEVQERSALVAFLLALDGEPVDPSLLPPS